MLACFFRGNINVLGPDRVIWDVSTLRNLRLLILSTAVSWLPFSEFNDVEKNVFVTALLNLSSVRWLITTHDLANNSEVVNEFIDLYPKARQRSFQFCVL